MTIYFLVFVFSLTISNFTQKKMEETLPLAFSFTAFLMFLLTRFFSLELSAKIALLMLSAAVISAIYFGAKYREKALQWIFCPGTLGFIVIVIFFILFDEGRGFVHSDDFSFWGYGVHYMYKYGTMYSSNDRYPPVPFLWEYLATKTWIGYSEGICMAALAIWSETMLLPLYKNVKRVSSAKWWITTGYILLLPISLSVEAYDTLVPDFLMSAVIAYTTIYIYQYIKEQGRFNFFCIWSGLLLCMFTKRLGVVLTALLIGGFVLLLEQCGQLNRRLWLQLGLGSVILSALYALWPAGGKYRILPVGMFVLGTFGAKMLGRCQQIAKENRRKLECFALLMIGLLFLLISYWCSNHAETGQIVGNYLKEVVSVHYSSIGTVIRIPLLVFLAGVCILLEAVKVIGYEEQKIAFKSLYLSVHLCLLVSTMYLVLLCYLYISQIVPANEGFGVYIPSFERYVLPCYYSILAVLLTYLLEDERREWKFGAALFLLLIASPETLCSYMYNKIEPVSFYGFEKAGITLTSSDKIYFVDEVDQSEVVRTGLAFVYSCMPAECDVENDLYGTGKEPVENHISWEEWESILEDGYTYVYLQTLDDSFSEDYRELFQGEIIEPGTVYKVEKESGSVRLVAQ